jgi:dienelactone hydrolase
LLILQQISLTAGPEQQPDEAGVSLAWKARQLIGTSFHLPLSTSQLAKELHCNADYLGRVFRRVFHLTPTEAIHRQRVRAAEKLLLNGSASLTEVATLCGFNDVGYFRQIFSKHTGLTPAVWKRRYCKVLQQKVDPVKLMNDFFAAIAFMQKHPDATGKVGITGFCYGGGVSNAAAVAWPELACAVPFYGRQPPAADAAKVKAPLLLHFAELDKNVNEGWPAWEAALKANNKVYEAYIYPGVNHGFHNDSTPRYDEAAAELAWKRTLGWFEKYLS